MGNLKANLICLFSFLLLLSCIAPVDMAIGKPKIQSGPVKLTGKIISPKEKPEDKSIVEIFVPHPISGEIFK